MRTNPCESCESICCRYVAVEIDDPEKDGDFDVIRWYLLHRGVWVFVEDGVWYVEFRAKCRHLDREGRCQIYPDRPEICRDYDIETCEKYGEKPFDLVLKSVEDLDRYLAQRSTKKK